MPNFKELAAGSVWRIVLETSGPRTLEQQEVFRVALKELIASHQTTILGYKESSARSKKKRKAKRKR